MTLDGTNTWVLREPGGTGSVVVDPGPLDEGHLTRIAEHGPVRLIVLTHGHLDHSEGAPRLHELTGAPVLARDPALCIAVGPMQEGTAAPVDGVEWLTVLTHGHSSDSVCFVLPADRALLTGDTILGRGTTVVAHPDGRLSDYLASLERLRELADNDIDVLLTGHGPVLDSPVEVLDHYLRHRSERLEQVRSAGPAGGEDAAAVVRRGGAGVAPGGGPGGGGGCRAVAPGVWGGVKGGGGGHAWAVGPEVGGEPGRGGPLVWGVRGPPPVPGARFCHNCGAVLDVAGMSDPPAERRVVTVLFGDLSDFTAWAEDLDPERVGVVTDRVLAALSCATVDMGGRVDKLTGDGIMAVFGAPTAHEDDAERAVRAAARMQSDVRRLMEEESGGGRRMGLRVGLNTGEVLAGVQAHLTYTVVGDTVNTASRLSDAAGVGAVFAGRETALATMSLASWRALPPLRLKGKREPVPAYELVGLRPPGAARLGLGDEAPFIGRDAEFGRLVGKLLDVVDGGRTASVVLTGEAGVGKTRLAVELHRLASQPPGGRGLWGRCTPFGEGRELAPLAEWVRMALGITDADDAAVAEARARRTLSRLSRTSS